jgi:tetratricopeptide (TPR) repeat protein
LRQGNDQMVRFLFEEALRLRREVGHKFSVAVTLGILGNVARRQGDYERAAALLQEGLAIQREIGNRGLIIESLNALAHVARDRGDYEAARARYEESLAHGRARGDKRRIAVALEGLAAVAKAAGDRARAVRWFGAAAALREACGALLLPNEQPEHEAHLAALHTALCGEDFAAAWSAGQALTWEQMVSEALANESAKD